MLFTESCGEGLAERSRGAGYEYAHEVLENPLVDIGGHDIVDLTVHQRGMRLHFQYGVFVQFVDGAATGGGQGRAQDLDDGRQLVVD